MTHDIVTFSSSRIALQLREEHHWRQQAQSLVSANCGIRGAPNPAHRDGVCENGHSAGGV